MSNNLELRVIALFKKVLIKHFPKMKLDKLSNEEIIDKTLEYLEQDVNYKYTAEDIHFLRESYK